MKPFARITAASLVAVTLMASTTACTRDYGYSSDPVEPTCSDLLGAAIQYERSGTGNIDSVMQSLSDNCSDAYEIAADYLSNSTDSAFSIESCEELLGYGVRSEAVDLLVKDGRCSFGESAASAAAEEPSWPDGGLGWDKARSHAGSVQRVCGPLMSVRGTDDGTFVNVGQDYPSVDRFTFVFWDIHLEPINSGATICGIGEIYLYGGVAQLEMWDPSALEIWR